MKNNKLGLIFKVKKETLAFPVSENTTITANIILFPALNAEIQIHKNDTCQRSATFPWA